MLEFMRAICEAERVRIAGAVSLGLISIGKTGYF